MGLWNRLFSNDHRAAVAAEAAGDLELAAERYALAGHLDDAARVHLLRAERAKSRADEVAALRDAVQWAPQGEWARRARRALGNALLASARAEGVATDRDRARVREGANHLLAAGDHRSAGEAYELIGDDDAAVACYRAGGLVDRLEDALERDAEKAARAREVHEAWADYEVADRSGDRDGAVAALRRCVAAATDKAEYRRRLDELEGRLVTVGRVELAIRRGGRIVVAAAPRLVIGRDPLVDLALRSGGVSREHAAIARRDDGYVLEDLGSKNGTRVGGLPIGGPLRLVDEGRFALGDAVELAYRAEPGALRLAIDRGLDRGTVVRLAAPGDTIDLAPDGVAATLRFDDGRPRLCAAAPLTLNDQRLVQGEVQLVRGDQLSIEGVELEVAR